MAQTCLKDETYQTSYQVILTWKASPLGFAKENTKLKGFFLMKYESTHSTLCGSHAGIKHYRWKLSTFELYWQHVMKKWTQQDLRFYKNEGSKRSNNNEKGGQQDRKSRTKLV